MAAKGATFEFKNGKSKFTMLDKIAKAGKQPIVKVGFPRSLDVKYQTKGDKQVSGPSVTQVAIWNEYGATIDHPGGTSYGYATKNNAIRGEVRFLKGGKGVEVMGQTAAHTITIPPRPFMETTRKERRTEVRNFQKGALNYLVKNGGTIEDLLSMFAVKYVAWIQETITKFDDPGNADSTIAKKKGSDNPLIDSGLMRSSVTWEIDDGN